MAVKEREPLASGHGKEIKGTVNVEICVELCYARKDVP